MPKFLCKYTKKDACKLCTEYDQCMFYERKDDENPICNDPLKYSREMTEEISIMETEMHIDKVFKNIKHIINELTQRGIWHDDSKKSDPELQGFVEYGPKLKTSTYMSEEYLGFLQGMKDTLKHHYDNNRHHPEHFENGYRDMNLVDLVEMFCDWYAATKRHDNGNIYKSIEDNKTRFGLSEDVAQIFRNTAKEIFKEEER